MHYTARSHQRKCPALQTCARRFEQVTLYLFKVTELSWSEIQKLIQEQVVD